ncbi:MAG: hypothetical protein ACYT04_91290 [Nostoc sp.]
MTERKRGDLRITYKGHEFKIEAKSLQTARNKVLNDGTFEGVSQVDASDRRTGAIRCLVNHGISL